MVFALAEVLTTEQLLRADDLRACVDGAPASASLPREVRCGIGAARHLRQADVDDARRGADRPPGEWSVRDARRRP